LDRPTAREQRLAVVIAKMRRQLGDRAQVQPPVGQHGQDAGEPPRHPRDRDAEKGLRLGKAESRSRIHEHRLTRLTAIEPSPVDLGQMPDELRLDPPSAPDDLLQPREQCIIG
jgi:hypothetical protein